METYQTIISISIIIIIFIFQIGVFESTLLGLKIYRNIFPNLSGGYSFNVVKDKDTNNITGIETTHKNIILEKIVRSINSYLYNNQGSVSDFHILKDIVDRNCDSKEEEINTQIPIPIYLGLMGTMIGILMGVFFLMNSGSIEDLLNIGSAGNNIAAVKEGSANGISGLLSGVGVAMISSILGIFLNIWASSLQKRDKAEIERRKNDFLSWIQAELLPQLSTDTTMVFEKVTRNLIDFNNTFSKNTDELKETLSIVGQTTKSQVELIEKLNKLNIYEIASLNIQVYDKLKNSTEEIGQFAAYLDNVNGYINGVNELNKKLDEHDARTKAIEDMGFYFKEERSRMEKWDGIVSASVAKANEKLSDSVEALIHSSDEQIRKLKDNTRGQTEEYRGLIDDQSKTFKEAVKIINEGLRITVEEGQNAIIKLVEEEEKILQSRKEQFDSALEEEDKLLKSRNEQFERVFEEIQSLSSIKNLLSDLAKATREQNNKLDELVRSTNIVPTYDGQIIRSTPHRIKIPLWVKISGVAAISIIVLPNLITLITFIISII